MEYPPPPGLVFLAYLKGSITEEELVEMIEMWHEKHEEGEAQK